MKHWYYKEITNTLTAPSVIRTTTRRKRTKLNEENNTKEVIETEKFQVSWKISVSFTI